MSQNHIKLNDRDSQNTMMRVSPGQLKWLSCGFGEPGGKLPLFDSNGQKINERTIRTCIKNGWAEPWFSNPIKPDWLVCKLTSAGRTVVQIHSNNV